jgi:ParB family chromosome partitioning protein
MQMTTSTQQLAPAQARTTYPLRALFATETNTRKKKRTPEMVMNRALSINAFGGLLQNLVVVPEVNNGKRTGRAGVTAGETRRLALCLLADGKVPEASGFTYDYPVPVLEVPEEEAVAVSAVENIERQPMHPADEAEAFRTMFDQCGSIEHIAAAFHVSPLVVQRRLKLAAASPKLFALFRNDGMTIEQLMALCLTDDHARQEQVWNGARSEWQREPRLLRDAVIGEEVDVTKPIARFVTVKAYEEAGGAVRRDLFSTENEGWLADSALLQRLAEEKLERTAATVRKEGWGWVELRPVTTSSYDLSAYSRATKSLRALTDAERDRMSELEQQVDTADKERDSLYEKGEDECTAEDDERIEALSKTMAKSQDEINKMRSALAEWTPEVLSHAGAIITFDRDGRTVIHRGLVKAEHRKAVAKAAAVAEATARGQDPVKAAEEVNAGKDTSKGALSESLIRRLTAHRTVALQRVIADNTQVALAALAHNMVQRLLDRRESFRVMTALDLQAKDCEHQLDGVTESSVKLSRAWQELQQLREQWGDRMPGEHDRLLPWLIRLPITELCDLLALCTALTLNAVQTSNLKHQADALAEAVGLDMADWWEPSADEYLSRVPKALIVQALAEASMSAEAANIEKMKKGEAVAKAADLLQGKRWLPGILKSREA